MLRFASAAALTQSATPITAAQLQVLTEPLPRALKYGLSDLVPDSCTARLLLIAGSAQLAGSLRWDDSADARQADGTSVDVLVVQGDLELDGDLFNREGDYGPGLLVLGSVRARNVMHGGAVWVIASDLQAEGCVVGYYNHGQLHVGGQLSAALLLNDDHHLEVSGDCLALDAESAVRDNRVVPEVLDYRNDCIEINVYALLDRLAAELPVLREAGAMPTVLDAAMRGDLAMLNTAFDCGGAVDALGVDGLTALMMAADQGREDLVERLLAAGASVQATGPHGWPALRYACAANHVGIVERLLAAGAEVDAADDRGTTALHSAISHNRGAAAMALLAHGAQRDWPRHEARKLFTSCFTAPFNGYDNIDETLVLALLDGGLDVGLHEAPPWPEPILAAAQMGSAQLLARLLAPTPTPPRRREGDITLTPLHYAAMAGRVENVQLLLEQPWAPSLLQSGDATLLLALAIQGPDLLERLQKNHGSPRRLLPGPLADERLQILSLLVAGGAQVGGELRSLPLTALSADPLVLKTLLEAGASAEACDAEGATLLFLMVCHAPGNVDVALATLLLQHGADPNASAPGHGSRNTAFAVAAGGDLDMLTAFVDALLRRDASGRAQIPALLDIAMQARERNRDTIVLDSMYRHADAQSLAPLHELLRERPRLQGDDAHLDDDRQAIAEATQRALSRWPTLQQVADEARQALAPQREQDLAILAGLRARLDPV